MQALRQLLLLHKIVQFDQILMVLVYIIILSQTFIDFYDSRLMSLDLDLTFPAKFRAAAAVTQAGSQQANCKSNPVIQT